MELLHHKVAMGIRWNCTSTVPEIQCEFTVSLSSQKNLTVETVSGNRGSSEILQPEGTSQNGSIDWMPSPQHLSKVSGSFKRQTNNGKDYVFQKPAPLSQWKTAIVGQIILLMRVLTSIMKIKIWEFTDVPSCTSPFSFEQDSLSPAPKSSALDNCSRTWTCLNYFMKIILRVEISTVLSWISM